MTKLIEFAILGVGAGAIYGLVAIGIVLIHRGSGVINFAHGAIGMVGTYVYWKLSTSAGVAPGVAVVAGIAVAAVLGLVVHLFVMQPMNRAAILTRIVATLAILVVLQSAAFLIFSSEVEAVNSLLPTSGVKIFHAVVGQDRLWLLLIGTLVTAGLWTVYRFTGFGRATTAVAENSLIASTSGISPSVIAGANWMLGSALAACAGILIAPIASLQVTGLTLLVIPALAAAMAGNLMSFPLTFIAGVAIGIAQSVVGAYVNVTGAGSAIPAIAVMVVVVVRGSGLPLRSFVVQRLPRVGTGVISVRSTVIITVIMILALQFIFSLNWIAAITASLSVSVVLLSIVVVTGYAGQISLAQFGLAGVGALAAAHLVANLHVTFLVALIGGTVATLPLGLLVGLPALRSRGVTLAVATLALAYLLETMVFANGTLDGGISGLNVGNPRLFGLAIDPLNHPARYTTLIVLLFVLVAVLVANLRRSRIGHRLLAIRDNERAAASLGLSVVANKLYAFAISGMIAGLGGVLFAFAFSLVTFEGYTASASINLVSFGVVGGLGFVTGPLFGGAFQSGGIGTQILSFTGQNAENYLPLIGGVLTLWILIQSPDGLAPANIRAIKAIGRRLGRLVARPSRLRPIVATGMTADGAAAATHNGISRPSRAGWRRPPAHPLRPQLADPSPVRVKPRALTLRDVTVDFAGVRAVDHVSLRVDPGEIVGLIGPNGAGKTTVIDAITGFVRMSEGSIELDGQPIERWSVRRRALGGIGRLFQSLELFEDLSILDNLRVAASAHAVAKSSYISELVRPRVAAPTAGMLEAIRAFGIEEDLDRMPEELSYGRRRLAAIARSVAAEPSVLLLDEPAAGLAEAGTREIAELVRELAKSWSMGILVIEHDVDFVMSICDRVVVLDFGKQLAEGHPADIRSHPAVIAAYLG